MPIVKDAYTRYRLIDEAIRNKQRPYPSLRDLAHKCGELLGKRVSTSSIQKDIYAMRFDEGLGFMAPIEYMPGRRGYYYSDPNYSVSRIALKQEDLYALEFAAGLLRQFKDYPILEQFDNTIGRLLDAVKISRSLHGADTSGIIQVEQANHNEGNRHLEKILRAITEHIEIRFSYYNFSKGKTSEHHIHPYLIREYKNRWYMTGYSPAHGKILTFGLDRMKNLHIGQLTFARKEDFNAKIFFYHSFGITVNDLVPVKIILSFKPVEGLYIKAQPIHHTQKILKDTRKELRIRIEVIPSQELNMQILSYGDNVTVISPAGLVNEIRSRLVKALDNYR